VISWQQRDVNRPPDPVLKLTAIASFAGLYSIGDDNQVRSPTCTWRRVVLQVLAILNHLVFVDVDSCTIRFMQRYSGAGRNAAGV